MMDFFKGLFQIILGAVLVVTGISLGVSWVAFCFGSVVIGILLLILAPAILVLPFGISTLGLGYIASGVCFSFNIGCAEKQE
jgi:hypothetical protein